MRAVRLKIFLFLFNQKNKNLKISQVKSQKILILRLDGKLGDTITITGFLEELHHHGFSLDIVTRVQQSFIYNYIPTPFHLHKIRGFLSIVQLFLKIWREDYQYLICTTHLLDPVSLFLARFVKSKNKMVFLNQDLKFFDFHLIKDFESMHVTDRYQQFLKYIGILHSKSVYQYQLNFLEADRHIFNQEMQRLGWVREKYFVLNSFSGSSDRNLSFALSIQIIQKLLINFPDYHVISIGSTNDLKILNDWKMNFQNSKWHVFDNGDFGFNASVIEKSALVITPDTAVIHLASALNSKVVGLYRVFGDTHNYPVVWAPMLPQDSFEIVYGLRGQLNSISCDDVVAAVSKLVK